MGGVLTHLSIGIFSGILIYLYFKIFKINYFYYENHLLKIDKSIGLKKFYHKIIYHKVFLFSLSIFIGNIIVDFFKFFIPAIIQKNWKIFFIKQDELFLTIANITNNFFYWVFFIFIFFIIVNYLYKKHIINKRNFFEFDEILFLFLIGVLIHLIVDFFVIEKGVWI